MGLPLITRAEYKAYAGITSTTQDAKIDALLDPVSALVKTVCRRTFVDYVDTAKVDYFDGGTYTLIPSEGPVIAIASLEYSSDYGETYEELTLYTDYAYIRSNEQIRVIGDTPFTYLPNGYKLTYTCGYETLPVDLKLAVFDLVTYYLKNDMSIHSPKAPGTNSVQIEYVLTTALPAHIKRVLDLYTDNYY